MKIILVLIACLITFSNTTKAKATQTVIPLQTIETLSLAYGASNLRYALLPLALPATGYIFGIYYVSELSSSLHRNTFTQERFVHQQTISITDAEMCLQSGTCNDFERIYSSYLFQINYYPCSGACHNSNQDGYYLDSNNSKVYIDHSTPIIPNIAYAKAGDAIVKSQIKTLGVELKKDECPGPDSDEKKLFFSPKFIKTLKKGLGADPDLTKFVTNTLKKVKSEGLPQFSQTFKKITYSGRSTTAYEFRFNKNGGYRLYLFVKDSIYYFSRASKKASNTTAENSMVNELHIEQDWFEDCFK